MRFAVYRQSLACVCWVQRQHVNTVNANEIKGLAVYTLTTALLVAQAKTAVSLAFPGPVC